MENSQHFSFLSCGWNKLKLLTLKQVSGQISGRGEGAGRRQESGARVGSAGPISVPSPQRQPTEKTVKLVPGSGRGPIHVYVLDAPKLPSPSNVKQDEVNDLMVK